MNDYLPTVQDGGDLAPYYTPPPSPLPASTPEGLPVDFISEHQPGNAPMLFGQPLSAGVTAEAAQRDLDALANGFTQAMQRQRIPQQHTDAAVDWFRRAAAGTVPREWPAHPYNLDGLSFPREDQPYTTAFCNAMHKQRVPQPVVRQMLGWYAGLVQRLQAQQQPQPQQQQHQQGFTDAELDAIDARADADREAGMNALRIAWGYEMPARLALVRRYVKNLPAAARERLENAVLPGGRMAANDPSVMVQLYDEAVGLASPPVGAGSLAKEIASIEDVMRTDPRRYRKDELMQARLRELYRRRDG